MKKTYSINDNKKMYLPSPNPCGFLKGQSLIEVVVVIALTSMVLVALVVLGNVAVKNSKLSVIRSNANKLNVSAIEAVKYVRDNCGYLEFKNNTCYVVDNGAAGPGSVCGVLKEVLVGSCTDPESQSGAWQKFSYEGQNYERAIMVTFIPGSNDEAANVVSRVRWAESNGTKDVVSSTVITNR